MRKAYTALLPFDGQLLAVAGKGPGAPTNPSPMAKYSYKSRWDDWVYTNEHHIFNRGNGEQPFSLALCIRSAQIANLRNFEIALRKLEIVKLLTNFETGFDFKIA